MKNELRNIISGTSKVSNGAIIQTISSYLKRSAGTSEMAKIQKHFKKQETEVLKDFILKNNLWVKNIDISNYVSEGAEQRFFLNDSKNVIKLNDGIFYTSRQDYLNNLLLHNFFFPDTAYNLVGFWEENQTIYAVVKQPFVKATTKTELQTVKEFLSQNGFLNSKNNDYFHPKLGIILENLHDENVLTKDGVLHFIDTVFFITEEFYVD